MAPVTGSVDCGLLAAARDEPAGGLAEARGFEAGRLAFGRVRAAAGLLAEEDEAAAFAAPSRLSLRRPGRDRGRLPRTLGSFWSSGMTRKNTRASGLWHFGAPARWTASTPSINVAAGGEPRAGALESRLSVPPLQRL